MSATLAFLDGLGAPEVLVIGVISLLMFGSKRMPELGRALGRAIREFKRATSGVEENIREVLYDEKPRPRLRPPTQRRPYRDPSAHTEIASSGAATNSTPPAAAPRADANLNEIAPLEAPDFAGDAEKPDTPPRRNDSAPPSAE